jgi:hypothetical protein
LAPLFPAATHFDGHACDAAGSCIASFVWLEPSPICEEAHPDTNIDPAINTSNEYCFNILMILSIQRRAPIERIVLAAVTGHAMDAVRPERRSIGYPGGRM